MGHGIYKTYDATIAIAASQSTAINLGQAYHHAYLYIPSVSGACVTATCSFGIVASPTGSETYNPVYHPTVNTSAAETNIFATPVTVSSLVIPIPNGLQYIKIDASNTMTAALACQVIVADAT